MKINSQIMIASAAMAGLFTGTSPGSDCVLDPPRSVCSTHSLTKPMDLAEDVKFGKARSNTNSKRHAEG